MNDQVPDRVTIELPLVHEGDTVGGTLRPQRFLTLGRRRSDRATFYALILAAVASCTFVVATSWRMDQLVQRVENTYQTCRREP